MPALSVAFLGTGGIAEKHSLFLKDCSDVQIVGGCDIREDAVSSLWQRTWGDQDDVQCPPSFTDADQMYEQTKPDAVVICSPHTLHFEHCTQAIDRGCHVLVEKPMVTAAADAYKLRDKVKESGKVLIVAFNTSFSPEFSYVRNTIRDKSLGELRQVCGYLTQPWLRFVSGSGTWRMDPKLSGGGQAYDSGAHMFNSLCWSVESNVAKVQAFVDSLGHPVDINSNINVLFENGVMASIVISGECEAHVGHMTFIFTNGRIDVDGWGASWMNVHDDKGQVKYPKITDDMDPGAPAKNFVDAILGRADPRTGPNNGIVHSELMDAIYESARTGSVVTPKRGII